MTAHFAFPRLGGVPVREAFQRKEPKGKSRLGQIFSTPSGFTDKMGRLWSPSF